MASILRETFHPQYETYVGEVGYGQITINLVDIPYANMSSFVNAIISNCINPALNQYDLELFYLGVGETGGGTMWGVIPTTKVIIDLQIIPKGVAGLDQKGLAIGVGSILAGVIGVFFAAVIAAIISVFGLHGLVALTTQVNIWKHGYDDREQAPTIGESVAESLEHFGTIMKWGAIGLIGLGIIILASEFTSIKAASRTRGKVSQYAV